MTTRAKTPTAADSVLARVVQGIRAGRALGHSVLHAGKVHEVRTNTVDLDDLTGATDIRGLVRLACRSVPTLTDRELLALPVDRILALAAWGAYDALSRAPDGRERLDQWLQRVADDEREALASFLRALWEEECRLVLAGVVRRRSFRLFPRDVRALEMTGQRPEEIEAAALWEAHQAQSEQPLNFESDDVIDLNKVQDEFDRLTARLFRKAIGSDVERTIDIVSLEGAPEPTAEYDPLALTLAEEQLATILNVATEVERRVVRALLDHDGDRDAAVAALGTTHAALRQRLFHLRHRLA